VGGEKVYLGFFWLFHYDIITSTKGQNFAQSLDVFWAGT